jgi:hypothetical protein
LDDVGEGGGHGATMAHRRYMLEATPYKSAPLKFKIYMKCRSQLR